MSWEVFLVLNLTITAPAVALVLTFLTCEVERIFRGEGTRP